jgi:hypothetical protein
MRAFSREEQYATLQARLEELRQNSSLLKKKAILADSSLIELHEVRPVVPLPTSHLKADIDSVRPRPWPR